MILLQQLMEKKIKDTGLSERQVAAQIGVSPTTVGRILDGMSVDVDTLVMVCKYLDVSPALILDAQIPNEVGRTAAMEAILQSAPDLRPVFDEAARRVEAGEISPDAFLEVLRYAAYRFQIDLKTVK